MGNTTSSSNVLDPGDLPPSAPKASPSSSYRRSNTSPTQVEDEDYQEARAHRLLNDIDDLDLSPAAVAEEDAAQPYDPYDDDEEQQQLVSHHSLPSSPEQVKMPQRDEELYWEEHRHYRRPKREHDLRRSVLRIVVLACCILGLLVLGIVLGVAVGNRQKGSSSSNDTDISRDKLKWREEIVEWLHANGITSMKDIVDANSPQNRAIQWLANDDVVYRQLPTDAVSDPTNRFLQRYVLVTFFYAMDGENWNYKPKFMTEEDECAWSAVGIGEDYMKGTFVMGVSCNPDLKVETLMLPQNKLAGSLPSEMKYLTNLEVLSLPFNNVTGEIPDLSPLKELIFFDMRYNNLEGTMPEFLANIRTLEVLTVSNNDLSGTISPSFGSLARLHTLGVDDNNFTGSIDFVNSLKNLEFFYADRNSFTGIINEDFLSDLTKLFELDLSSNLFTSENIPLSLFLPRNLRILDLSDNLLEGTIPSVLPINQNLEFLSLRYNQINGTLSVDGLHNLKVLKHLDLYDNQLTGHLPASMNNMVPLVYLSLGHNDFDKREVPNFLFSLTSLRELSLQSTQLTGFIPDLLGDLTELVLLDLSQNELQGPIPSKLFNLPKLEFLLLNDNSLNGGLPSSVANGENLRLLSLHNNSLGGDFGSFCAAAPNMDLFAVDCANIQCGSNCCPECCQPGETDCFLDGLNKYLTAYEGLWEYNYNRAIFASDLKVLDEYPKPDSISTVP